MRFDKPLALLSVLALAACGSTPPEEEPVYAPVKAVDLPDTVQSKEHAVVMRLTDGTSTDTEVYRALNQIIAEMKLSDLLTRGGYPTDREGNVLPFGSGSDTSSDPGSYADLLAGTSVEQVRAYLERTTIDKAGPFPQAEAIEILSLLGLLMFPLWMAALVWAYMRPFSVPVQVVEDLEKDATDPESAPLAAAPAAETEGEA